MTSIASLRSPTRLLPALCGLLAAILIVLSTTRYGVGLSADSAAYISTARNLMNGEGYTNFKGEPLLAFPPLYPTVLAVFDWGWFDLIDVARYVNAAFFGLIVAISTHWLTTHTASRWLSLLGAAAILLSVPLIEVSVFAWSEPLFILGSLLSLLQIEQFLRSDRYEYLVLAGVFAALAALTRYAGLSLILTGTAVLLLNGRPSIAHRIRDVALFCVASLLPVLPWFLRNYVVSSTFMGYRVPAASDLVASIGETISVGTAWFLPTALPVSIRAALVALLFLSIISIAVWTLWRSGDRSTLVDVWHVVPLAFFIVIYTAFLIRSVTFTALSAIDDRYLSPIYVPLVLTLIFIAGKITTTRNTLFGTRMARAGLLIGLTLWLSYPAVNVLRAVRNYRDRGAGGFHTARWVDSDLIKYLRAHPLEGLVFSNDAYGMYLLTGQVSRVSPAKHFYESQTLTRDLVEFKQLLEANGHAYLVWFDGGSDYDYLVTVAELGSLFKVELVVTTADGTIYTVRSGPDRSASSSPGR